VMPALEAAEIGDVFVTLTGDIAILRQEHFERMRDGAIIANSGHFNVEIDIEALEKIAKKKKRIRRDVDQYTLPSGKRLNLLGEGRLINLAAAEGHPAAVMDMSFANQALACEYLLGHHGSLKAEVIPVPERIDREIAALKLHTMGYEIDRLTDQQQRYLTAWREGT
jgi:adenosylhomocysteinase